MKFTIEPDRALADRLNPTRDDCQQIYQLLKAQKTSIQSDSSDGRVFMVAGARNRRYSRLNFAKLQCRQYSVCRLTQAPTIGLRRYR